MLPYQTLPDPEYGIAIVGIGGAGANILQCFGGSSAHNVRLCTISPDERVGRASGNVEFIQLGAGLNHGLGSGGDPEVARQAMRDSHEEIAALLQDKRLLVMVVGLGGGTGSGAAPMMAEMAREAGIFLVSVLVMPFAFEGARRRAQADAALEEISRLSDIVFCFENDYMEELFRNRSGARAVFEEVNRILARATACVPTLASSPGLINLGLDELATALENNESRCLFGSGSGYGPHRATEAANAALESPLITYRGAMRFVRTVIVHIAGGDSMSLTEIRHAMETVREKLASDDVCIFFGVTVKPQLGDEMRVTLIASINSQEFQAALMEEPEAEPMEPALLPKEAAEDVEDAEDEEEALPDKAWEAPSATSAPSPESAPAATRTRNADEVSPEEGEMAAEDGEVEAPVAAEEENLFPMEEPLPATHQASLNLDDSPAEDRDSHPSAGMRPLRGSRTPARVREIFPGEDAATPRPYSPEATRRRMAPGDNDDLDTPPSLRFNDLRDMFPDN